MTFFVCLNEYYRLPKLPSLITRYPVDSFPPQSNLSIHDKYKESSHTLNSILLHNRYLLTIQSR